MAWHPVIMRVRDGKIIEALGYSKTPASDQTGLAQLLEPSP
jgi:hypothetical protein